MAIEDFDLEAALNNIQSASGRRPTPEPVERVHVFLPGQMRAERKGKPEEKKASAVPWCVNQPDWNAVLNKNSTTEPVQTSAQQLSLPGTPVASFTVAATPPTSSHFGGTAVAIVSENSPGALPRSESPILIGAGPRRCSSWSAVSTHTTARASPGAACRPWLRRTCPLPALRSE